MSNLFGYVNEITEYLKTICTKYSEEMPDFSPYFLELEDARDFEKEKYGDDVKVSCFRSLGYTIGHVYVKPSTMEILDFCVYKRNIKDYNCSCQDLEKILNEKFKGKVLFLTEENDFPPPRAIDNLNIKGYHLDAMVEGRTKSAYYTKDDDEDTWIEVIPPCNDTSFVVIFSTECTSIKVIVLPHNTDAKVLSQEIEFYLPKSMKSE